MSNHFWWDTLTSRLKVDLKSTINKAAEQAFGHKTREEIQEPYFTDDMIANCSQMLEKEQWPPNNSPNLNGMEISCLGSST